MMSNPPRLKNTDFDPDPNTPDEDTLRRLIRLVVGFVLIGQDALRQQLPLWEAEAQQRLARQTKAAGETDDAPEQTPWLPKSWEYRLIGLAFESPKYVQGSFSWLLQANRELWRKTAPLRLPLDWFGISASTNQWLADMDERLRVDLEHLEQVGENEAQPSRMLGRVAIQRIYSAVIDDLSEDQKIKDLIAGQSIGITEEVIEEVRERSVSFDLIADQLVRRILRLKHSEPGPAQPNRGGSTETHPGKKA
jgi:hypothetical protein